MRSRPRGRFLSTSIASTSTCSLCPRTSCTDRKASGHSMFVRVFACRPSSSEAGRSAACGDPGSGGEIQLTDALKHLLRARPVYAYRFEGTRYDAGDKLGFLKATVEFALRRHD